LRGSERGVLSSTDIAQYITRARRRNRGNMT
jgi:hypothetical protein